MLALALELALLNVVAQAELDETRGAIWSLLKDRSRATTDNLRRLRLLLHNHIDTLVDEHYPCIAFNP